MATAFEKFVRAVNKITLEWRQAPEVSARNGRVVKIEWNGFVFSNDKERQKRKNIL